MRFNPNLISGVLIHSDWRWSQRFNPTDTQSIPSFFILHRCIFSTSESQEVRSIRLMQNMDLSWSWMFWRAATPPDYQTVIVPSWIGKGNSLQDPFCLACDNVTIWCKKCLFFSFFPHIQVHQWCITKDVYLWQEKDEKYHQCLMFLSRSMSLRAHHPTS